MVDKRVLAASLVWESSDLEESFEKRRYLYVRNVLCVLDESKYDKIFTYKKETTKLGYDVYLKYDKFDDYIKISFLTSHMIPSDKVVCVYGSTDTTCASFVEMVRYSVYPSKWTYDRDFQTELIRERAGRILDEFFYQLIPEQYKKNFKIERVGDFDPLDGIGNFAKNPEYLNGGFHYFSPVKNDFIYDINDRENNFSKSIELYEGDLIGYENDKTKKLIDDISDLLVENIDDYDRNIYDGIAIFVNYYFSSSKSTWITFGNFKFRKYYDLRRWNYNYQRWDYAAVIQYKNKLTKETGEINFGYNYYNGNLYDNPYDLQINRVIKVYKNITDKYLKYVLFYSFISKKIGDKNLLANKATNSVIDTIIKYKFPEEYIDDIIEILKDQSDNMETRLSLYMSYSIIPYKETCYMYSKILFDVIPYYLNGIMTNTIDEYSLNAMKNPFDHVDIDAYDSENPYSYLKTMINHFFPTDYAIRLLCAYKIVHQRHSTNMFLTQIRKLAESFKMNEHADNGGIYLDILYRKQEILMLTVLIFKLSDPAIIDTAIVPHYIFDICKFYITGYRQIKNDYIYNGKHYTTPASKYDINLIVSLNMLANRMIKKPEDQSLFTNVIKTVNHLVGGRSSWVYKSYDVPMKNFAFFMLNTDRLDNHLIDRYNILIGKVAVPYPAICGVHFGDTIKNTMISHVMPYLWQQKLTDGNFDDLELIAKPFEDGKYSKGDYNNVKSGISEYLTNIDQYNYNWMVYNLTPANVLEVSGELDKAFDGVYKLLCDKPYYQGMGYYVILHRNTPTICKMRYYCDHNGFDIEYLADTSGSTSIIANDLWNLFDNGMKGNWGRQYKWNQ